MKSYRIRVGPVGDNSWTYTIIENGKPVFCSCLNFPTQDKAKAAAKETVLYAVASPPKGGDRGIRGRRKRWRMKWEKDDNDSWVVESADRSLSCYVWHPLNTEQRSGKVKYSVVFNGIQVAHSHGIKMVTVKAAKAAIRKHLARLRKAIEEVENENERIGN